MCACVDSTTVTNRCNIARDILVIIVFILIFVKDAAHLQNVTVQRSNLVWYLLF